MWQRGREVRAGLAEALATVTAVVFAVGEGEGSAATHADIRVNPFGRLDFREPSCQLTDSEKQTLKTMWTGAAYCRAVYHATCDTCAGRKVIALLTKGVVDGAHVGKFVTAFGSGGPALDQLEDLCFDVVVDAGRGLEDRYQVIHKLARGHLCKEVGAAILDARVCQAEGAELRVWVFMANALPE